MTKKAKSNVEAPYAHLAILDVHRMRAYIPPKKTPSGLDDMRNLCVEDFELEKIRLTDALRNLNKRCSHKYRDGTDATETIPVSCEKYCHTCGAQFD